MSDTVHCKSIKPVLPQIETVVFLMLENRSLDNLLGWLYSDSKPSHCFPVGSSADFDGIPQGAEDKYHTMS